MTVAITSFILAVRILAMTLYNTVHQAIGLYSFIVAGLAFLGTNVTEIQLIALWIFPVLKNLLITLVISFPI